MQMYEGKAVEEEEEELRREKKVKMGERLQITEPTKIKVKEGEKNEANATIWVGCESDELRHRVRRQLLVQ